MHSPHTPPQDRPIPLPPGFDTESTVWFRSVLLPLFDRATSWPDLQTALGQRGYTLGFSAGHMTVIDQTTGRCLCTGSGLGAPLASLVARLGRPTLRLLPGGCTAELVPCPKG